MTNAILISAGFALYIGFFVVLLIARRIFRREYYLESIKTSSYTSAALVLITAIFSAYIYVSFFITMRFLKAIFQEAYMSNVKRCKIEWLANDARNI